MYVTKIDKKHYAILSFIEFAYVFVSKRVNVQSLLNKPTKTIIEKKIFTKIQDER